jgi:predicted nucleotidyltransferase
MPTVPGLTVDEARLADVCARYGIARLRVFGSVARGTATADSDIDALYELAPGRRLGWEIEQLTDEPAAVFGRPVATPPLPRRHPPRDAGSTRYAYSPERCSLNW